MREAIDSAELSYEQQEMLRRLQEADLRGAFDAVLRERGLPMTVSRFELSADPTGAQSAAEPDLGTKKDPPPGGCYCCFQDEVGGPWICYCC